MMISCPAMSCRELNEGEGRELYLTASPPPYKPIYDQALELYRSIAETLTLAGARLFAERIFATAEAMPAVEAARKEALGELDDGVSPTRILVEPGISGPFAGVQVHAISADTPPVPLRVPDAADGRELRIGSDRWLMVTDLSPQAGHSPRQQAEEMFDRAGKFLHQAGTDMKSVARTWLWLKEICDWYGDLNAVRTRFFEREGLIGEGLRPRLPASTGIGLSGASGAFCTMDLIALPGREGAIKLLEAGGEQNSAFAYGSAFSRAAVAPTPGGQTLFISGTAAIDTAGRTEHIGQIQAQIRDTIKHVRALLADAGCGDEQILSALVYCKTSEVEQAFLSDWAGLNWPSLTLIGDVCRPELLFEIELAAGPARAYNPLS